MSVEQPASPIDLAQEETFVLDKIEVRPPTCELVVAGRSEKLEPRVMQVLVTLARRRGKVVSRDELIARCWGGRIVSEDALNRCISAVRRVAEAYGGFQVNTVTRVGYRLDTHGQAADAAELRAEPLLAVLAFDNLSGDPEMAYFSDGLSEEILHTVSRGARLKVVGRSSSFQFRGSDKAVARVVASLGATHVLDGSVRRSGATVRVSASLIECERATAVWSQTFDRHLADVFALQDEIAAAVAKALDVVFTPPDSAAQSIDPAAYDLFLKANQLGTGNVLDGAAYDQLIGFVEEATAIAPRFARAWGLLTHLRASKLRYGTGLVDYADQRARVIEAADTALRLDPGLGGVYHALATLEAFGRFSAREVLYNKALVAWPHDTGVLVAAAFFVSEVGRVRDALDLARRSLEVDPMNFATGFAFASYLDFDGRHVESKGLWDTLLREWPASDLAARGAIANAVQAADWDRFDRLAAEALPRLAQARLTRSWVRLGQALRNPQPAVFEQALGRARDQLANTGTVAIDRLASLCELGLLDEAFGLVERASFSYMFDPALPWASGPLSGGFIFSRGGAGRMMCDPRFVRLCARLGLCDYWVETSRWPDCADHVPYDFRGEARKVAAEGLVGRA
ncbi:MAG TPA: winged helix-turn-helix domain-containing protein [Caulobacteraceae bacterium]|jgi:TolB-like protein